MWKRAQIATRNAEKVANIWNAGKHIVGLTKLALYDIVILCGEFIAINSSILNGY